MKVTVNPQETLTRLRDIDGKIKVAPIQEHPFYLMLAKGDVHTICGEEWEHSRFVESQRCWGDILYSSIKLDGFVPAAYGTWPTLRGQEIMDGAKRMVVCAFLGLTEVEVENILQEKYVQWDQAFQIGDGWLDITKPPDWEPRREFRSGWADQAPWRDIALHVNVQNKSVLDVGCAQGYYCQRAIDHGAKLVRGWDRDQTIRVRSNPSLPVQDVVAQARDVAWLAGYGQWLKNDALSFVACDFADIEALPRRKWHIVLAMKVTYHLLDKLPQFLKYLSGIAVEALVIQANPGHLGELAYWGGVERHREYLDPLWKSVTVVDKASPLIICKKKTW